MDGLAEQTIDLASLRLSEGVPVPYVLSWVLRDGVDGEADCSALALMKREEGVLLALPESFLPANLVDLGNSGADNVVGM